jgi:hypothetical protein
VNLSVHYHRDISSAFEKLHNLFIFSRQLSPSRFSLGILCQPAQLSIFETEINLFYLALGGLADGAVLVVKLDASLFVDQGLRPDGEKGGFKTYNLRILQEQLCNDCTMALGRKREQLVLAFTLDICDSESHDPSARLTGFGLQRREKVSSVTT